VDWPARYANISIRNVRVAPKKIPSIRNVLFLIAVSEITSITVLNAWIIPVNS
jgi:hypothetical protein